MKTLIGTYKNGIYEIIIDLQHDKVATVKKVIDVDKPAYLIDFSNLSYIFNKNNEQYLKIGNSELFLEHKACHLSYDKKNNLIYTSHYHDGLLKIINQIGNDWKILKTYSYEKHSHIHFALYIEPLNLVGVCDLGDDVFYLYRVVDNNLIVETKFKFEKGSGPRHFIYNKTLPFIYIINELSADITVLKYENKSLSLIQKIKLIDGAGSAIRISDDNNYLFTAVRDSNYLYSFKIQQNGYIDVLQKISTEGDHPRDFNLILDDNYLLAANMNSNNLSLYKHTNGILSLIEKDIILDAPSSILYTK